MSNVLTHLYNACNPILPASAEYYVDCSAVRGSNALTRQFQRELAKTAKTSGHLHFLFSGHIGCGKSSELEHLRRALEQTSPVENYERYFPVLLDAGEYLDEYDATPTDILLAIIAELAATLRDKANVELSDNYFVRRLNEVKKFFLSDVEIEEGELPLSAAKVKVQRLKKDPDARDKVRAVLLPQMTTLLAEMNTVFDEARLKLKQRITPPGERPYADIVLILDNLEKIQRIAGRAEGEASQRELFIERAPQLKELGAHVVYTAPLSLVRSHGPQLTRIYGVEPFVLPMIKVAERGSRRPYEEGRARLREMLQKRAGNTPLGEVFAPDALDWLLTYCGGHVRDLMGFVRRACNEVDEIPIPLRAAQRALHPTIAVYSTSIPASHWEKLARLDLSFDQWIDNNDPDYREMLEQVTVMEYINGGEHENPFAVAAPWYAVHPIVRELPQFKAAVRAESGISP